MRVGEAVIHFADSRVAAATCGGVFISVLRQPPTLENINRLRAETRRLHDLRGGKYGSLSILEPSAVANVAADVREASARFAREFTMLGAAIIVEGSGFLPAAGRTLIAGIYLLTKKTYPHKIFAKPADGAAWLVPILAQAGVLHTAAELLVAAEAARQAIVPQLAER